MTKKFHRPELPSTLDAQQSTAIEAAIKAVKWHGVSRAQVSVPERPGIHGGQRERWRGVAAFARGALTNVEDRGEEGWDLPAYGLGGWLGNYWSARSGIEVWDKDLFISQANTMTELVGVR